MTGQRLRQKESVNNNIKQAYEKINIPWRFWATLLASCQDDNTLFSEPMQIRAYETDVQIMSQFIEADNSTGLFVLNPDKKIMVSDYLLNRSREELMKVSQINKNRFLDEMESVNSQLRMMKRSGLIDAYIYTTQTDDKVIMGKDDSLTINNIAYYAYSQSNIVTLNLEEGKMKRTSFFSTSDLGMNIYISNGSTFFLSQLTLGDQEDEDAKIIVISGIKPLMPDHSYRIFTSSMGDNKTLSGMTLIGSNNITVSISK